LKISRRKKNFLHNLTKLCARKWVRKIKTKKSLNKIAINPVIFNLE